ncbi:Fic family protein [Candidatus Woesearchaeota archaeon]|nr:Fic family protein [Candidatus Woesearchaeota archaeon]
MVSIVTKTIKGKEYLYLVESEREGDQVRQKTIKYIGVKRPILEEEFDCMKISHKKEDWILHETKDELSYQQQEEMKKVSDTYQQYVKHLDTVSKEKEREKFLSAFIANSNAIEGSTLSVKDTFQYLFNDIVPAGKNKKELFMAFNLLQAWEYAEKHAHLFPTEADIKTLHALVNKNIEEENTLGKYKNTQNYIGDVFTTSFLFVEERMKSLFSWLKKAETEVNDFEIAFQSHAQFEIIHPFIDGNGRVGRLLLNWLLLHKNLAPLAIHVERRSEYITALDNVRKEKVEAICLFCYKEYMKQYKFVEM